MKTILLIALALLVFIWLVKAPIMASYLTNKMRVPVSVGRISMWPTQAAIGNFKINNPRGFKTKIAFKAGQIQLDYAWKGLVGNPSEIDQILIQDCFLGIEFSNPLGTQNNWTKITANMPKEEHQKEVIIRKLVLMNMTVEVRGLGLEATPRARHIDRLEFDDISNKNGFPTQELIREIFGGAGLDQYIKEAFNPESLLEKILNPFG